MDTKPAQRESFLKTQSVCPPMKQCAISFQALQRKFVPVAALLYNSAQQDRMKQNTSN